MTPCELSVALNTAANAMAANLSNEELALLTAMFRQMYEALTGILLYRRACSDLSSDKSDKKDKKDK
ncbi:MAG: hypothetical protein AAGU74_01560 [Bacillota bacterium]